MNSPRIYIHTQELLYITHYTRTRKIGETLSTRCPVLRKLEVFVTCLSKAMRVTLDTGEVARCQNTIQPLRPTPISPANSSDKPRGPLNLRRWFLLIAVS